MTELNEGNEHPLTTEDNLELLRVSLATVKRATKDLGIAESNPFDAIDLAPPTGEMHTASDSPEFHKAVESLNAASAEIGTAETIAGIVTWVGEKFGLATL